MCEHMNKNTHIPVLMGETISMLKISAGMVVVDGTLNAGGHSKVIAEYLGKDGVLVGIDRDEDALELARENLKDETCDVRIVHGNYRDIATILATENLDKADRILLDIGLSSRQLDVSGRGFSFKKDEPLLMTFERDSKECLFTAQDIVNEWDEENIADILYGYGDERFSRRIARGIIAAREIKKITTTHELVDIVSKSIPAWYRHKKIAPATKTFQALRIAVNDELGALRDGIDKSIESLKPGGRLAIITFHSGEDRIVKHTFRKYDTDGIVKVLTKRPLGPSEEEIKENPRSRSAKLRVVKKN